MRTTLTLDDDVAARLEKLREERDASFESIVNDLLRRGLDAADRPLEEGPPYRIEPWTPAAAAPRASTASTTRRRSGGRGLPGIPLDVSLLVYAEMAGFEEHEPARAWLEGRPNGRYGVGLPWSSLLGFVRLATNHRVFERPMPMAAAREQVDEWLALPSVFTPEPTHRHAGVLVAVLEEADHPRHVPGAHLAALAIEYGLTLQSTDRGFARFSGLLREDPLEARPR